MDSRDITRFSCHSPPPFSRWIPGCITEWRDMKAHEDVLYVVTDRTQMCECEAQPCAPYIEVRAVSPPPVCEGVAKRGGD